MRSATRRRRKPVDSDRPRKRGPPIYRPSSRSGRRRCYGCRRAATTAAECERVVGVLLGGCCIGLGCANGPHCTWFLTAFGSIAVLFLCCCFFCTRAIITGAFSAVYFGPASACAHLSRGSASSGVAPDADVLVQSPRLATRMRAGQTDFSEKRLRRGSSRWRCQHERTSAAELGARECA